MTLRKDIFEAIEALLGTMNEFKGDEGSNRVYSYAPSATSGFPYAVVSDGNTESEVHDNIRDSRTYDFNVQIVGEKFGGEGGLSQKDALLAMREMEDAVLTKIDGDNDMGRPDLIVRTMPSKVERGVSTDGLNVVLTILLRVDTFVEITM